ncbi:hypothetical protein DPEC_G00236280 [Dallia pectoralis]|uniref:Uncharacterized protein n=1 Tax=Dallia pectoralis TaxID=75939 RepID=A0ACC2FY70_DALPE|nr:hypothetical protein DPEC_G00236280 [Dallia pectoralis]
MGRTWGLDMTLVTVEALALDHREAPPLRQQPKLERREASLLRQVGQLLARAPWTTSPAVTTGIPPQTPPAAVAAAETLGGTGSSSPDGSASGVPPTFAVMTICQKLLHILFSLSLLSGVFSLDQELSSVSLWGKMAKFTAECRYWQLRSELPALTELSVCLHLQLKIRTQAWTAFMYLHPDGQRNELGLEGQEGLVHTWLFGVQRTASIHLSVGDWHYICMTWSGTSHPPSLYVNGTNLTNAAFTVDLQPSQLVASLASRGTLTLGVSHSMVQGEMLVKNGTNLIGGVSLFRMWGQAHTPEQVSELNCTEGNVVRWDAVDWLTGSCPPAPDSHLHCAWSKYELKFKISIICSDGTSIDPFKARDLAHEWLRMILPLEKYNLYRVSVLVSNTPHDTFQSGDEKKLEKDKPMTQATFAASHFDCLVHLNVFPKSDVSSVQMQVSQLLNTAPNSENIELSANNKSIQVNAVENFPPATVSPPITPTADLSVATVVKPSDMLFEVSVNVSFTGSCDVPRHCIYEWLEQLGPPEMYILNFKVMGEMYSGQYPSPQSDRGTFDQLSVVNISRYGCLFRVQVTTISSHEETKTNIRKLLEDKYTTGLITIHLNPQDISIKHIVLGKCNRTRHQTRQGLFEWPATMALLTATQPCQGDRNKIARRHCQLGSSTSWELPDLQQCPMVVETILDLGEIEVTPENAIDVVEMIKSMLKDDPDLNCTELDTVLNKLKQIVFIGWITPPLGKAIIDIISDILESKSPLQSVTNEILNITEMVGNKMFLFDQTNYTLVAPGLAITAVNVDPVHFQSLTFGVLFASESLNPEIYLNKYPFRGTVAFISLPSVLKYSFPQHSGAQPRIQFQFYGIPNLFMTETEKILNTFVVSASVTNATGPIKDLEKSVEVTLHHLQSNPLGKEVQCVYWDFNQNDGKGGWNPNGCRLYNTSTDYTTCLCDHLTHFGVLLDISRTPIDKRSEEILTLITYLGCGVSSVFLGVTVLTYTAFEKLRRDYPSKILINLSLALLGLNMVFLVNSWLSSVGSYGLCLAVASFLHYFLLASFTWMGLEAVHMYFALVKVFNVYVPSYILKFCTLGWGIPLVICCLVLVLKRESYGSSLSSGSMEPLVNSEAFCWIQDEVAFYVSVGGYILLVLLFNTAIFVVVLVQIRHMRVNHPVGLRSSLLLQDLKGVSSLTFLLGLTWTLAFFAWGPAKVPLTYVFCILNSLQGFFVFLFHCLMKENVRKQWRIHLCLGRFRLQDYSEWSQTAPVSAKPRPRPPARVPSVRSIKSSSTDSTSASSNSSQRQVSIKRPNLDLVYKKSLALPRVQLYSAPYPQKSTLIPEAANQETWQNRSHPRQWQPIT